MLCSRDWISLTFSLAGLWLNEVYKDICFPPAFTLQRSIFLGRVTPRDLAPYEVCISINFEKIKSRFNTCLKFSSVCSFYRPQAQVYSACIAHYVMTLCYFKQWYCFYWKIGEMYIEMVLYKVFFFFCWDYLSVIVTKSTIF